MGTIQPISIHLKAGKKKKKKKKEKHGCVLFLKTASWCDEIHYLKFCEVDFRDVIENNKLDSVLQVRA